MEHSVECQSRGYKKTSKEQWAGQGAGQGPCKRRSSCLLCVHRKSWGLSEPLLLIHRWAKNMIEVLTEARCELLEKVSGLGK